MNFLKYGIFPLNRIQTKQNQFLAMKFLISAKTIPPLQFRHFQGTDHI